MFNEILLWSPLTGRVFTALKGHQGVIFNIEYSLETNYLYSTSDDRSINVYRLKFLENSKRIYSSELYTRFYGHEARVWRCISFIQPENNTQYLCSIGEDLNLCLWNVNEKSLVYRFNAMRKGCKNIWSLCKNENSYEIITGWCDGGLRKIDLKHYINSSTSSSFSQETEGKLNLSSNNLFEHLEWNLACENDKDFMRNILVLNGRILCCTNMGCLYLIDTKKNEQKLLFKSILLTNFNCMTKTKLVKSNNTTNNWLLAIGTLKGFIYLLNIEFDESKKDVIKIDCINCLGIEEELAEADSSSCCPTITLNTLKTAGTSKIFNLLWFAYQDSSTGLYRYFLLACFSLINGLMHLYEYNESTNQLYLIARLYLPVSKHRWLTSFCIISAQNSSKDDNGSFNTDDDEVSSSRKTEKIYLLGGDKGGNLHLYKIKHKKQEKKPDNVEENYDDDLYHHLIIVKPAETLNNVTKESSALSAIYCREFDEENSEQSLNCLIICCAKDGFYRVYEFNCSYFANEEEKNDFQEDEDTMDTNQEGEIEAKNSKTSSNPTSSSKSMLKLINKYQISSYIDVIESFIFENCSAFTHHDLNGSILSLFKVENTNLLSSSYNNDLENSLKLALCFYGDKFMLWNFQLNRCLFDYKCGGANRSWDCEFVPESGNLSFRFFYIKNKSIGETRRLLSRNEIERPFNQNRNHFCQIFHGNTLTTCKYLKNENYLLTGAEDTQLILNKIENKSENDFDLTHLLHLQGRIS